MHRISKITLVTFKKLKIMKSVFLIAKVTPEGDVTILIVKDYEKAIEICQLMNLMSSDVYVVNKINILN